MQKYNNPDKSIWKDLIRRPEKNYDDLKDSLNMVFEDVKINGDHALLKYTELFDKVSILSLEVTVQEISEAQQFISEELKRAINLAYGNIKKFHEKFAPEADSLEIIPGVNCGRIIRPIEKVGLYIPGGSAPLFSTILMLGVPAKIAGCNEIILTTPPDKYGKINPVILYTASLLGINKIFKIGGMQAIAALSYGTESIPSVYKIFGPGNQFVTRAKLYAQSIGIAIDMPAGPSEALIVADKYAYTSFVAADLIAQAEHGPDSQVILLTNDIEIMEGVINEISFQLNQLPRKEIILETLKCSRFILLDSINTCLEFSNKYAPEHLILAVQNAEKYVHNIQNAGSVFLGNYSCESLGDYASGPNHTLPTGGYAHSYSGISVDSFVKKITVQKVNEDGIRNLGPSVELMAEAEDLMGHKNAVTIRLKELLKQAGND